MSTSTCPHCPRTFINEMQRADHVWQTHQVGTYSSVTFSLQPPCRHLTGWYVYPEFLWMRKEYFACTECHCLIPAKKHRWLSVARNDNEQTYR